MKRTAIIPLVLLACGQTSFESSSVVVISGDRDCSDCKIERYLAATLDDADVPGGALGAYAEAHITDDGHFFVHAGTMRQELYYASPSGIEARVGQVGDGPGEYRWPMWVMETPDQYTVLDMRLARLTHLRKGSLELLGTSQFQVNPLNPPVALRSGLYAVNMVLPDDPELRPVQIVTGSGEVHASLGNQPGSVPHPAPHFAQRVLAPSRDGKLWVGHIRHYRVEKWDLDGNLLAVYERRAPWFPLPDTVAILNATLPRGAPSLLAIHEDVEGRLWTSVSRMRRPPDAPPGLHWDKSESDAVIEVWDLGRRRVLATNKVMGIIGTPTSGAFGHSRFTVTDEGYPLLEIWGYQLRDGKPQVPPANRGG
jgi:hypothetical protein